MSWKYFNKAKLSRERMYDVIAHPIISEKATLITDVSPEGFTQVTFQVPLEVSKPEIRQAVEGLFDVKVVAVNTLVRKGKTKRFRGRLGRQQDTKKAIVTLDKGQSIDVTTGL
jgi:large subunit ribosomal protein L23